MLKQIILVGLGGGLGSIFRFLTSYFTGKYVLGNFPVATFVVNILGCLILGLVIATINKGVTGHENLKLLFITGFCGGFTTFSTFAFENVQLFNQQHYTTLIIYSIVSICIGFTAILVGMHLGKSW